VSVQALVCRCAILVQPGPEEVAIGNDQTMRRRGVTYELPIWRLVMPVIKLIPEPPFQKLSF
jgi:hypothetical protein